jgi:Zn-dependent protease with chaperone function
MVAFILGFALGLIASPVIRSWLVWREYRAASRAAWLAGETLRRLEEEPIGSAEKEIRWR